MTTNRRDGLRIRTLTAGICVKPASIGQDVQRAGHLIVDLKKRLVSLGVEVQTTRLTTQPAAQIAGISTAAALVELATELETVCLGNSIEWCCIGPHMPQSADANWIMSGVFDVVAATRNTFVSIMTTTKERRVDMSQIGLAAQAMKLISKSTAEGFGNFRFAAISCCPPHIPFFPAGYHIGKQPGLSIGLEYIDDVLKVVQKSKETPYELKSRVVAYITEIVRPIQRVALGLCKEHDFRFMGFDTSLAPFPTPDRSIGTLVEELGVRRFGEPGTMFVTAFLSDCARSIPVRRCGFCGVFYPVLEDSIISKRNNEGFVSVNGLLSFSSVCGVGLDLIPVSGDVTHEQLMNTLWKVAKLSEDYRKPLVARLLPIPEKSVGDITMFDFPYCVNTRIMDL